MSGKTVTTDQHTRYKLVVFALLLCAMMSIAQQVGASTLSDKIDRLLQDPCLAHGIQGVLVKSLASGSTLYERNADTLLIPASNMKLLVSAAALDRLGPDFVYKTELYRTGKVDKDGVLRGDLVLVGGGDPTLDVASLAKLANLRSAGIRKVAGDLVVDDTMFDDQRLGRGWNWDDVSYYYSAEISALNLHENAVGVYVTPGTKVGEKAVVRTEPETRYVTIANSAITAPAGSEGAVSIDRCAGTNVITVKGTVPIGYSPARPQERITVDDPAMFAGTTLKAKLAAQGVVVTGRVKRAKKPLGAEFLCEVSSPPFSQILAKLNKPSDNLIAEVLLKTLGYVAKGRGSTDAGRDVELEFLQKIGIGRSEVSIADGSGLSRMNYITPRSVVTLLTCMHSHPNGKFFTDSLPIAGVDGTLRNRMKGTACAENLRAKTGYVTSVSSLSGYLNTKSGEQLVFSIIMNNHLCANKSATAVQDAICELLAESD